MQSVAEFQIQELMPIGMTLVVLGIGLAYGLQIMGDTQDDMGTDSCSARADTYTLYNATSHSCYNSTGAQIDVGSAEFNATTNAMEGVAKLPEKLPTIVTVIVAAIVIGILIRYLFVKFA